jgi:phosphate transport system substrate-binding protein
MRLALLAAAAAAILCLSDSPSVAQGVTGAGSTFAHPVLNRWSQAYQREQSDAEFQPVGSGLDYEPIGSQAGIMRVRAREVDFGATDVPLGSKELETLGLVQFPIVIGGVVAAVNVGGVEPGQLKLTGEILADIYLGRIKMWSDPAIKTLNPELKLPDVAINVVRRSDGSGTTYNFTDYLSKVSTDWQTQIGRALSVAWPVGLGAKGNGGIADAVKGTLNSIGYVEFAQAQKSGLSYAALKNRAGNFVVPSRDSFQAAAASADWTAASDFNLLLADAAGPDAYPIVATTFVVVSNAKPASRGVRATLDFFRWSLEKGGSAAAELGYVPLPPALVGQIKIYWARSIGVEG